VLASLAGGLAQDPANARRGPRRAGASAAPSWAPTSLSILANVYDEGAARNRAFGLWGTLGAFGGASGALVGGLVTGALSVARGSCSSTRPWRSPSRSPPGSWCPPSRRRERRSFRPGRSAIAVTPPGSCWLTYGVRREPTATAGRRSGPWGRSWPARPLALFALIETYVARTPLVPPRMLRSGRWSAPTWRRCVSARAPCRCGSCCRCTCSSRSATRPLRAGLAFLPMSLTILVCTQAAGRLAARVGSGPRAWRSA
jgi:hypothetical protein